MLFSMSGILTSLINGVYFWLYAAVVVKGNEPLSAPHDIACVTKGQEKYTLIQSSHCRTSGLLISHDYPFPYGTNLDCNWEVKSNQENKRIQFQVVVFHGECPGDRIILRDISGPQPIVFANICSSTPGQIYTSFGRVAHVQFESDEDEVSPFQGGRVFALKWRVVDVPNADNNDTAYCLSHYEDTCGSCGQGTECRIGWVKFQDKQLPNKCYSDSIQFDSSPTADICQKKCTDFNNEGGGGQARGYCVAVQVTHEGGCMVLFKNRETCVEQETIALIDNNDGVDYYERVCRCQERAGKNCDVFQHPYATKTENSTHDGVSFMHVCNPGFVHSNGERSRKITCVRGVWDNVELCSDADECKRDPCVQARCINNVGSFVCECHDGFTLSGNNRTCIDDDECENITIASKCNPPEVCINLPGEYKCGCFQDGANNGTHCSTQCEVGYWGSECHRVCGCAFNKTCNISTGLCPQGCKEGYEGETCQRKACLVGWWGDYCTQFCRCYSSGELQACDRTTGQCPANAQCARQEWNGPACNVFDEDGCEHYGKDGAKLCENGGSCQDIISYLVPERYWCVCRPGFYGKYCEHDLDECTDINCGGQLMCVDKMNGYSCESQRASRLKSN